jgi:hypothetical protein
VVAALVWASLVSTALAFSRADYASALDKSILFFDLQRSGRLPSWQRLKWRGNSGLNDGRNQGVYISITATLNFYLNNFSPKARFVNLQSAHDVKSSLRCAG